MYYDHSNFRDVYTAINIGIQAHLANAFLQGDITRVIYASTEFALRKRSQNNPNLDLPFCNFRISDITADTDRPWFNHELGAEGMFVPELARKIKIIPVSLTYDSTIFFHKYADTLFSFNMLHWDDTLETVIKAQVEIEGQQVSLPGVLGHSLTFNPTYNENDWLERNKINSISLNFQIDTFSIVDNVDITIPETVIFNFITQNELDQTAITDPYQAVIDHLSEDVGEFSTP